MVTVLKCKVDLVLKCWLSHPVEIKAEDGTFAVEKNTTVRVSGVLKNKLGIASNIRSVRPPEPYKGKVFVTKVNMFAVKKVKLVNNR